MDADQAARAAVDAWAIYLKECASMEPTSQRRAKVARRKAIQAFDAAVAARANGEES